MNNTLGSAVKEPKNKMVSRESSLTPAVLGISGTPSASHGAKLLLNMDSKDKEHLIKKLNEWRNARKEKLIAKIMAKQKLTPQAAPVLSKPKVKAGLISGPQTAQSTSKLDQSNSKTSVFERLYNQAGKQVHSLSQKAEDSSNIKQFSGVTKLQTVKTVKPINPTESKLQSTTVKEENKTDAQRNSSENSCIVQSLVKNIEIPKEENVIEEDKTNNCNSNEDSSTTQSATETAWLPREDNVSDETSNHSSTDDQSDHSFNSEQQCVQPGQVENEESIDGTEKQEKPSLVVHPPVKDLISPSKLPEQLTAEITKATNPKDFGKVVQKTFKIPSKNEKAKPKLRRSLSTIFRTKSGNYSSAIHRSEGNLVSLLENEVKAAESLEARASEFSSAVDNLIKEKSEKKVAKNKSVCLITPKNKTPSVSHLRDKLETWLAEKGHSINTYGHLKCFGLHYEGTPIPSRQPKFDDSMSFNNSFYSTAPSTPVISLPDESNKENVTPPVVAPKSDVKDVEDLLNDLYSLIVHAKYPRNRCEEWLHAILKKYPKCNKLQVFWECAAAINLDTDTANVSLSMEREGKEKDEPESTVETLAHMLDKLVIDEKCDSPRTERGLDVKNILRSKTVKFALKEKSIETESEQGNGGPEKIVVVTPVRRSSRLQTPNKSNVIGSLKSFDPDRTQVSFKPNEALLSP